MLKNAVENERHQVNALNHQIFELKQKLYETGAHSRSMSDSLESGEMGKQLHIKIDVGPNHRSTTNDSGVSVNSQSELGFNTVEDLPFKVYINRFFLIHFSHKT